ncbi:MAG: fibronectin type III domain-containing protein [Prevotellaceae bacterium]|jgi:hypothetical protein|nr:fibronectin type III domain-containing protein [Prevotellaceae bacterium]
MKIYFKLLTLSLLLVGFTGLTSCSDDDNSSSPKVPTELKVSDVTATSATLSWTANNDANSYEIQINDAETSSVTATNYELDELEMGTKYTWKIRAKKDELYSEWVDGEAFTTL